MTSPLLAESLASFSRATHEAVVAVQTQVQNAVALAKAEASEARRERDEARRERDEEVQRRHEYQLDLQTLKQEVGDYKAALKQADTTINHQEETIAQVRREAAQWKDQSRNWQDHFLRVEQERCKLSSRVDELVSEQLLNNQAHSASFTPRRPYTDIVDPAPSTSSTKRASSHRSRLDSSPDPKALSDVTTAHSSTLYSSSSSSSSNKITPKTRKPFRSNSLARHYQPSPETSPSRRRQLTSPTVNRSQTQLHKPQPPAVQSQAPVLPPTARMSVPEVRSEPHQVLVRRVQAVVEIPVKEEDAEDENVLDHSDLSTSASASGSASTSMSGSGSISMNASGAVAVHRNVNYDARRFAPTKPRAVRRRGIVRSDDEDSGLDDDYDEVEELNPHRSVVNANDHSDEEDDELMMGAEDNRRELYGSKPIDDSARNGPTGSTAQKRKVGGPHRKQQSKKARY